MDLKILNKELLDKNLGQIMDETRVKMAREDVVYQSDERDLAQLEGKYAALELPEEARRIIDDYIACLQTSDSRYADISYMAGIEDTIKLLKFLDLIKTEKQQS